MLVMVIANHALAQTVPDLTNGGTLPANSVSFNLGPSGMRGLVYHIREDSSLSRQIKVTTIEALSPAAGILAANDVILGASGTAAAPTNFTADARKSLADAINDAEARTPATLKLLVWRAGTTSTMPITLRTMGTYSATAPYNCPKSAQILQEGLTYIMSSETSGLYSFGTLTLLAANNPADPANAARMARAQTEARALIPDAATMTQMMANTRDNFASGWQRGHTLIFLSEYYLLTNDALVLPAIRAYAVNIAKNQSLFGTLGHIFSDPWPDGSLNGPMGGEYGVVNSAGVPCFLGLVLAKKCGITDAEITPAIERSSRFFAYYVNKGTIPYGEHDPYFLDHESNGKCGAAALAFGLQANRSMEARFFTQMSTASASEREIGHTGSFFNYLWAPLGAAAGGEVAAAAHFAAIRWHLDLSRKWNGTFQFDSLYGDGPQDGEDYNDFRMSTAVLLTYALPRRQLTITGRNPNPANLLNSAEVAATVAADGYSAINRTTNQLISDLGSWSPVVQHAAGEQLATRTLDTTIVNQLIALATDVNGSSRIGACIVLGKCSHTASAATRASTLAALLTDPQNHVRYTAADAMRYLSLSDRMAHLNTILTATASNARPLLPLNEEDPMHMAHSRFGLLLFNSSGDFGPFGVIAGSSVASAPKNLLYPAIRAVARNPVGLCRSTLTSIYPHLTQADFLAVSDAVVDVVRDRAPADRMFSGGARIGGAQTFQKFNIAEGVPACIDFMRDAPGFNEDVLSVLKLYAGDSTTVIPAPDVDAFCLNLITRGLNVTSAQQVIDAIAADTNPTTLTPLKSILSVTADQPTLTLPAQLTTLRVVSNDYAKGDSRFTWRKVYGAGNVTFAPNGTGTSDITSVLFNGAAGNYLFEVKMTDSRNYTEVTATVAVTLLPPSGTLPPNSTPVASSQSPSVPKATATPIVLTGTDPEGLPLLYRAVTQPTHGTLTGSAPYLVYTSHFNYTGADSFTFEAMDSEGQTSQATVNITVTPNSNFPTALYEPFNYTAGTLNGKSGASEVGLSGTWSSPNNSNVIASSLPYNSLPTLGGSLGNLDNSSNLYGGRRLISSSALTANGLLNDGSTLWFSVVMGYGSNANLQNGRLCFALANSNFSTSNYQYYIVNEGAQLGNGIGVTLGYVNYASGKSIATQFRDSTFGTTGFEGNVFGTLSNTSSIISAGQQRLVVGKITWGASSDTIELYEPDADLNLGSPTSTLTVNVNQSTFDTITWSHGGAVTMDEIRFGPNYSSVLLGNVAMAADNTAPQPATSSFEQAPTVISASAITMKAVTAFDPNGVEYYFTCTAGGGSHSGWQDSPQFTATGLTSGVLYSYTAKARDKSPARNQTTASAAASATISTQTTVPDLTGMSLASAQAVLAVKGLVLGTVSVVRSPNVPTGSVVSHTPIANQVVSRGAVVNFTTADDEALWNVLPTVNAGSDQIVMIPTAVPWSPAALTPQLWLDGSTATINAGTVSISNLGSGGGVISGPASLEANGIGTLQAVKFNGTSQYITGNYANTGTALTAFYVGKSASSTQNAYAGMMAIWANGQANDWDNVGSAVLLNQNNTTSNSIYTHRNATLSSATGTLTNSFLVATAFSGTNNTLFLNGTSANTVASAGNFNAANVVISARRASSVMSNWWNGNFGEAVICNSNLSAVDRQNVEGYLAHKWAMTTNLPLDHPYKTTPPSVGLPSIATLDATATDPESNPLTYAWSVVSGPAAVTFANAAAINTTATFTVAGVYTLRLTANDGFGSATDDITITVTTVAPAYISWMQQTWTNPFLLNNPTDNPDGDTFTNLQEFAFGTDPTSPTLNPLSYVTNGNTTAGAPVLEKAGSIYRAVFVRRKDYVSAGLTYTVWFSADLAAWQNSVTTPTTLSGTNSDPVETVSIDFPATVPLNAGGTAAPRFFRVGVSGN